MRNVFEHCEFRKNLGDLESPAMAERDGSWGGELVMSAAVETDGARSRGKNP